MTLDQDRAIAAGLIPSYSARADALLPQIYRVGESPTALSNYTGPVLTPPAPVPPEPEVDPEPPDVDPESPILMLAPHPDLVTVPAINLGTALVITPTTYPSWTAVWAALGAKDLYLTTAPDGDYTPLGPMLVTNMPGGTGERPQVIRAYNLLESGHPCKRTAQARIDGFKFSGTSSHWMLHGIHVDGTTLNSGVFDGATGNTIDFCLIENSEVYGIRVLSAIDTTVQRNVIRNIQPSGSGGDSVGIQWRCTDSYNGDCLGNRELDNEIYNCGDQFAMTAAPSGWREVELYASGSDYYVTSDKYIGDTNTTLTENAFDIKCGAYGAESTTIEDFRAWGFRRNATPTALGEAMVFQKYARNFLVQRGIIDDCPRGMKDENWPTANAVDVLTITADATTNVLTTATAHPYSTGAGPLRLTTTGTVPGGLSTATQYYAIVTPLDTAHLKVATSYANAIAGTAVDITTAGTGTNKIKTDADAPRTGVIDDVDFSNIRDLAAADAGAVFRVVTGLEYKNCNISRCDYLFDVSPSAFRGTPTFTGLVLSGVDAQQRPEDQTPTLPYNPLLNSNLAEPVDGYERYERCRWTGPEIATRAKRWIP